MESKADAIYDDLTSVHNKICYMMKCCNDCPLSKRNGSLCHKLKDTIDKVASAINEQEVNS